MPKFGRWSLALWLLAFALPPAAQALPVFAHRYGFSCQQCHTTVPQLNAFGEAFRANGFRLPGARGTFPIALRVNLEYGSAPQAGLPKAVVDEVELLSAGSIGRRTSYFFEQYLVDGGLPGFSRDVWLQLDGGPIAAPRLHARIGQFTLPLPVDPETLRPTLHHYAIYDQTVGAGAFNFFDPRIGIDLFGSAQSSRLEAHLLGLLAYDRQSGVPNSGMDLMGSLAQTLSPDVRVQVYRYQGQRHLAASTNRFWRQGYAAQYRHDRITIDAVLQNGFDSRAGNGIGARSSGGFLQTAYAFSDATQLIARYDGAANDLAGFSRSTTLSLVLRPARNFRFTLEGTQSGTRRDVGLGLLFAY